MNRSILYLTGGIAVGSVIGFFLGYKYKERIDDEIITELTSEIAEYNEPVCEIAADEECEKPVITNVDEDTQTVEKNSNVNYSTYAQKVNNLGYAPSNQNNTSTPDTGFNDSVEEYKKKKGDQIDVLGNQPIDNDYPEISYQVEELLYFIPDDIITDTVGNRIDEDDVLGNKLRRYGWFLKDNQMNVWVRNNKYQTDYHLTKIDDDCSNFFGDWPSED